MKVMFVYHNRVEDGYMPQSIAILGGALKEQGVETRLFDTTFYRDKDSPFRETDREIRENQKKGGYKKVEGFGHTRKIVDLKDEFYKQVQEYSPDLIAATSTSFEFNSLADFILPAKKELEIPVIVGGSHSTVAPYETIKHPSIDYVCMGEGERPLSELVRRIEAGEELHTVPNLVSKTKDEKIITNDRYPLFSTMDDTPEADWDLINEIHRIRPFEGELKSYGWFEMSRGCPHKCSYCINSALHEMDAPGEVKPGKYRFFSKNEIIKRMINKKEKYNYDHIQFIDENMAALPIDKLEGFAQSYIDNIGVGFFTQSRPEPFINNPKRAKIMADMGCEMIGMGMESGNEDLRKNMLNRPMKDGVIERSVEILREEGIKVAGYYIIGFPNETKEMIQETIDLHRRVKPDRFSVRFLHPFPGTKIRDLCVKEGYIEKDYESLRQDASFFKKPVLNLPSPPHPSEEELIELMEEFQNY